MRLWYLSHRWPAKVQAKKTKGPTKNRTSSRIGWLHMRVWRMRLWRMKSAVISWAGSEALVPSMPSIPVLGHRQIVQIQIRRLRTRHMIRVYTASIQEFLSKIRLKWKSTPDTPKLGNGLIQLIRIKRSTLQIWVKCTRVPFQTLFGIIVL